MQVNNLNINGGKQQFADFIINNNENFSESDRQIIELIHDNIPIESERIEMIRNLETVKSEQAPVEEKQKSNSLLEKFLATGTKEFKVTKNPRVFISYAWESSEMKFWVKDLASELRNNGIDVKIDQWELHPGDQTPHFMEKSVRENDYVLIICTPKYKVKSDNREGGVGYEGDIMTAEVLETTKNRKFIPILKLGTNETSIPSWLKGKYYINFSNEQHYKNNFEDLLTTLFNFREVSPPLGDIPLRFIEAPSQKNIHSTEQEIKIMGIIIDEVSMPLNDGSYGSALYKIPFELNKHPQSDWVKIFIATWNNPPKYTSMHRPGIAQVIGNKIILNGTSIEEVEKYHKETLKISVEVANNKLKEISRQK